jgi:hypothetical protein
MVVAVVVVVVAAATDDGSESRTGAAPALVNGGGHCERVERALCEPRDWQEQARAALTSSRDLAPCFCSHGANVKSCKCEASCE